MENNRIRVLHPPLADNLARLITTRVSTTTVGPIPPRLASALSPVISVNTDNGKQLDAVRTAIVFEPLKKTFFLSAKTILDIDTSRRFS